MPSAVATATTSGSPRVSVPVLSSTTVSRREPSSSAIACLKRIPRLAPRPEPTMIAVGVARPSASGHVITTTVMANSSASWTSRPTTPHHTRKVSAPPIERDQHEPEGGPVGKPLAGRLRVLGLLHELHDLRQRGVGADGGRAGAHGPVLVDRPAHEAVARPLVHRQALPGDGRLVDVALPLEHLAVDRDLGTGPDQQQVPDAHLSRRDLDRARRRGSRSPSEARGRAARGSRRSRRPARASRTSGRAARTRRAARPPRRRLRPR